MADGGAVTVLTPLGLVERPELPYTDKFLKRLLPLFLGVFVIWLFFIAGRKAPDSRFEYEDDFLRYRCKLDKVGQPTGTCQGFTTKDPSEGFVNKGDCETAVSCWRPSDAEKVWTCKTTTDDFGNTFFVDECVEVSNKEGGDLSFATKEACEASDRCGFEYPAECVEGGGCRKLDVNAYDPLRSNHYETLGKCKLACTQKYGCSAATHFQCAAVITDKGADEGFFASEKDCPADCAAATGGYMPDKATGYCTFDPTLKNPKYDDYGKCVKETCEGLGYKASQDAESKKWLCCRHDEKACGDTCCGALNCQQCVTGTDGKKRCVSTLPDTCAVCVNGEAVRTDFAPPGCSIFRNQVCACAPLSGDPATCSKTCYQRQCLNGQPYDFEGEKEVEICKDGVCKKHKCKDVSDTRPPDCWVCPGEPRYPDYEIWRYGPP